MTSLIRRARTVGSARHVLMGMVAGLVGVVGLIVITGGSERATGREPVRASASTRQAQVAKAYAQLPLAFEENRGQSDPRVRFLTRGTGYQMFLTARESVLTLTGPVTRPRPGSGLGANHASAGAHRGAVVRMGLLNAARRPRVEGERRLPGVSNYLVGRDASSWHRGVRRYGRVRYSGVYPGVDLVYYGHKGRLEYDFRVAPRADPRAIAFRVSGARKLRLGRSGNLLISTAAGVLRELRPVVYQPTGTGRRPVVGRYVLHGGNRVGFRLGRYDRARPLVIDPALVYSTYLGGAGGGNGRNFTEPVGAVAADSSGAAYVAGITYAPDFPVTAGAFQATKKAFYDVFVTKLSPSGDQLVYSTYLGGEDTDFAKDIAVDGSGRAYVTGDTLSTQDDPTTTGTDERFPTTAGAFQQQPSSSTSKNAFISVLRANGSGLAYSSFFGGNNDTTGEGIAVEGSGDAYVTGGSRASDLPTRAASPGTAPFRSQPQPYASDAFVAKFNPDATTGDNSLVYSTFLGAFNFAQGADVAVDGAGDAYVAGQTNQYGVLTRNAFQATPGGGDRESQDGFVSKVDATGSTLLYSTLLGGSGEDIPQGIALDGGNHAYVTGSTNSSDFPTKDAFQPTHAGGRASDAFVAKLYPGASGTSSLAYSSYLGGANDDFGAGIAVTPGGTAFVAGTADDRENSFDGNIRTRFQPVGGFPTVDPLAPPAANGDGFLAAVRPDGSGLSFSSYLGGGGEDLTGGVALDGSGNAYVVGTTLSTDFPTRNAFQDQNVGLGVQDRADHAYDDRRVSFVAKVAAVDAQAPLVTSLRHRSGPAGTSVGIGGHGFTGASTVRFGSVEASGFTLDSDGQITAIAPPGVSGSAPVTVTTPQGTSPPNPIAVFSYAVGTWDRTGSLRNARQRGETATLLADGTVLVSGGLGQSSNLLAAAEVYDPASGTWRATGLMRQARRRFTATVLRDGRVLVAGGNAIVSFRETALTSAELYDPATGTWSPTGPMSQGRAGQTATRLRDGRVLVAGGDDAGGNTLDSAELYDPDTGMWAPADSLRGARSDHTASLLADGTVLVVGGKGQFLGQDGFPIASAERYDPGTDSWSTTGSLGTPLAFQTATLLHDGRVLVAGGARTRFSSIPTALLSVDSAEIYDPATGTFDPTARMERRRAGSAAALLPDGRVLVTGGADTGSIHDTAELYDPTTTSWSPAGRMTRYRGVSPVGTPLEEQVLVYAVTLPSGKVLVLGDARSAGAGTELYDPAGPGGSPGGAGAPGTTGTGGPPPPPGPGGPSVARDTIAPRILSFGMTRRAFFVSRRATSRFGVAAAFRPLGTTFLYRLSEAARARIAIARALPGRRSGGRCVAPTFTLRHAKRCTRFVRKGTLTRTSRRGANRVRFSGRIGVRALRPGRYRATLTATDAARNRSRSKAITFRVLKR